MLNKRFVGIDALGHFRDKVLVNSVGTDHFTVVPAGTIAKSTITYYTSAGVVAYPQPEEGSTIPANTYYTIDAGSPSDLTRAPSVKGMVGYVDDVAENVLGPEIDAKVSSVNFDSSTNKLSYINGGSHDVVTFGDNAFNSTAIPTTYIKSASVSGKTLTLTKQDNTTQTFTETDTTYTFGTGSNPGTISVTPLGGSASDVSVKGLKSAAYAETTDFLAADGKAASATTADTAGKVNNSLTLKVNTGTTEGTDKYTFDGSGAKALDIKAGTNVTLTAGEGTLTISSADTVYTHPAYDTATAAAKKIGRDATGHVVIGDSLTYSDVGAAASGHNHDTVYLGISAKAASATIADSVNLSGVNNADDLKAIEDLSGTSGFLKKTAANTWTLDTNTYNNYVHPTTTAHTAAAVKVGNDGEGHVVLGEALTYSDVGAASSGHNHDSQYLGINANAVSATTASTASKVTNALTLQLGTGNTEGTDKYTFDGSGAKSLTITAGDNVTFTKGAGTLAIRATDTVYTHPTYDTASAAAKKIGRDSTGHVVIGGDISYSDVGAAASGHNHDSAYLGINAKAASATIADSASKVTNKLTLKVNTGTTEGTNLYSYDGSGAKTLDIKSGNNVTLTATEGVLTIAATDTVYTHPSYDAATAAAKKIGRDATGHVVIGDSLTYSDVGAAASGHNHDSAYLGISAKAASATIADSADKVNKSLTLTLDTGTTEGTSKYTFDGSAAKSLDIKAGSNVTLTKEAGTVTISSSYVDNDTKNTAGSTADTSKLFIIGAKTQAANPQTYSNTKVYIQEGYVYSNETKVDVDALAPKASPTFTGVVLAPTADAGDNSTKVATTAFVQTEISNKIAASDAMIYKGTIGTGGTVTTLPSTTAKTGWTYKVITAGTYAGQSCEVGDMIICLTDGSSSTAATWTVVQNNIDGAVTGPSSATDGNIVLFDGTTGKVIKNSSYSPSSFASSTHNHDSQYLGINDNAVSATTASSASKVANKLTLALKTSSSDTGSTEGTDKYTFDGSGAKNLTITAGDNVTFTKGAGTLTIAATDTVYSHPTTTAATAAAKKIGRDSLGHVVIGDSITYSDVGAAASGHNHDTVYLGINAKAASATSADAVAWSGVSGAPDLAAIEELSGTAGFLKKTAANTWTLDNSTYNNYSHPTGDGDLHVPATGTTNNGKVLVAGNAAKTFSWKSLADAGIAASGHNHDTTYLGINAKAASATSADSVPLTGVTGAGTETFTYRLAGASSDSSITVVTKTS